MPTNATRTMFEAERRKAEQRYRRHIDQILKEVERKIAGLSDPAAIALALRQITMSPRFNDLCIEAAQQITTMLAVGQKRTWRVAASASSQGRRIYKALMEETTNTALGQTISGIVTQNAQLIKTCPQNMALKLSQLAQKRQFEGLRPESIMEEVMQEAQHLREFEARRIARTESAKASTALVQARAEALNLDFYTWRTARDERVRDSHRAMNGVICRWSDPPNPEAIAGEKSYGSYHPGGIFNCRCIALPVIAVEDIKFPAKVHIGGQIVTIGSLKSFRERFEAA